ncbi:MAG: hypothetical protein HKP61_19375 [Dactylosporangium sp.]|nr:hypothetical protein [Dactylosporangium sp.]NNJ63051.1 hypothetical protein [Dactylosporangium sp.]
MNNTDGAMRRFGQGPLSQVVALVYTLLLVELLLLVTALPGVVGLFLLERDSSNVPLAALCAIPFGPALSAAIYALHRHRGDLTELHPAAAFWRGYRLNAGGVLRLWVPWLALLTVVGISLVNFSAAGVPIWWRGLLILIAVASTLWIANALMITSLFSFRARDIARLAVFFLLTRWRVTLGNAGLVLVAAAVTYLSSELVLGLLGSVFLLVMLATCLPMIETVRKDFTQ